MCWCVGYSDRLSSTVRASSKTATVPQAAEAQLSWAGGRSLADGYELTIWCFQSTVESSLSRRWRVEVDARMSPAGSSWCARRWLWRRCEWHSSSAWSTSARLSRTPVMSDATSTDVATPCADMCAAVPPVPTTHQFALHAHCAWFAVSHIYFLVFFVFQWPWRLTFWSEHWHSSYSSPGKRLRRSRLRIFFFGVGARTGQTDRRTDRRTDGRTGKTRTAAY